MNPIHLQPQPSLLPLFSLQDLLESNKSYDLIKSYPPSISSNVWEEAATDVLAVGTQLALNPRTRQLALMYLTLFIFKDDMIPPSLATVGYAALCIASKLEGDKATEVRQMKISAGPLVAQCIDECERYLLSKVLEWKTAFTTPFDFIGFIVEEMQQNSGLDMKEVSGAAFDFCELLFLSTMKIKYKSPYVFALASLLAAVPALSKEGNFLKSFLTPNVKEQVDTILIFIKSYLVHIKEEATYSSSKLSSADLVESANALVGGKRKHSERGADEKEEEKNKKSTE